ncbi:protein-disulfide reductase DsbD family protein [Sphingobium subterraneum]|uniref:Thiol:disulfide interchange protein/DsbC/DsbD-like thiol-disulfide interchange protein n=1 Tax=Sphingobium subterraneum TaxID=627688 RepID=A0A841J3H8_9SPHN|nr:protein-disulfide reductase DsbD domain-containing protein [Sphingobium subterraneum]MBB6123155.1 thiol:disulfide interchange protein/DsbC/DsbD-like thiol-disulfide interchange protein [Sphingobium subterraneum]
MRYFFLFLALILLPSSVRAQTGAFGGDGPHISARLVAETAHPAAGRTVTLAIAMTPEKGWHGYWANPGDAGLGMTVDWALPTGARVGALRYPVPDTLVLAGLMNHVFEGPYAVLVDVTLPAGLAAGQAVPVRAKANWLACTDKICVPESGDLSIDLTVGAGGAEPENRAQFDQWRARLPRPLGGQAHFALGDGMLRIGVPFPAEAKINDPWFFRLTEGAARYAEPQSITRNGDLLVIAIPSREQGLKSLSGVLRIGPHQGLSIDAVPGTVPDTKGSESGLRATDWATILLALGGALLGGLILNVMPCVFPILSLKAMSLARAGGDAAEARREAVAYTLGVVLTCLALGGTLLALRAGGMAVGWAFQLQNPIVILVLFALVCGITLNLAGVFSLNAIGAGGGLAQRGGAVGAFWTGALVAFVATPCTGPFMAAALGAALVLPVAAALAVFAGLGLGLALPFLLIGYSSRLRARLPRPGAWMERFQRWLAVPMALTGVALLWLLERQTGTRGLALALGLSVVLGAILWGIGQRQRAGKAVLVPVVALALAVIVGATMLPPATDKGPAKAGSDIAFTEGALASARASGKPVFVYFTADWCLSCKVNEASTIDRAEVREALERSGTKVLIGDWTNGDAVIGRFLETQGRSGVPLYLWYGPGAPTPEVLPQVLTPDMLMARARVPK